VPATCPYPEPARSSSYTYTLLPECPSEYYPPIYAWVSQVTTNYTPRNSSEKRRSHLHREGRLKSYVHGCHWQGGWHSSKSCEDSAHRTGNGSRTAPVKKMYSNMTKRQAWSTNQQLLLTNPFLSAVSESRGQQLCQYHKHSRYPFEKLTNIRVFRRVPKRKFGIICNVAKE
jgi:hypothetical protein